MAFNSSLSIEQITFKQDDVRCNQQIIDSFDSLVNFTDPIIRRGADSQTEVATKKPMPSYKRVQLDEVTLKSI